MDWDELAKNQSVKRNFAEFSLNLKNQPVVFTIMLRSNGKYVFYDDVMKTYINMTTNTYVEDLTKKPFDRTYSNYKEWKLCDYKDYLRLKEEGYI